MRCPEVTATLIELLRPIRDEAERDCLEAKERIRVARISQKRAKRDMASIRAAIADPGRFCALIQEFNSALRTGAGALDAFLNASDDHDLRGLLFALRLKAEFKAGRDRSNDA